MITDENLEKLIYEAIREHVQPTIEKDFNLDTPLSEIGMLDDKDWHASSAWINLVDTIVGLEVSLKVYLSDDDYFSFKTVRDIFVSLKKELKNSIPGEEED